MRFTNPNSDEQPFDPDLRQILPIISRRTKKCIVFSSINASYLWDDCKVKKLTKNMRLMSNSDDSNNNEIQQFSRWILDIGQVDQ